MHICYVHVRSHIDAGCLPLDLRDTVIAWPDVPGQLSICIVSSSAADVTPRVAPSYLDTGDMARPYHCARAESDARTDLRLR